MGNVIFYSPAKVNFSLRIGAKEACNLHKIHSLMRKLTLKDKISFNIVAGGNKIKAVAGAGLKNSIPEFDFHLLENENNLVLKAADYFFEKLNIKDRGIDVLLEKNIPFGAGLGGGSSDGAGMMLKLNEIYDNILKKEELKELALKIGSDAPFFLTEKDAIAKDFGDVIEEIEQGVLPKYYIVLIMPDFRINTKEAYAAYDDFLLTNNSNYYNIQYLGFKDLEFKNDFENVIFEKYPVLSEIKESLILNGAELSLLSGSGSVIFGAFRKPDEANFYLKNLRTFRFFHRVRWSCLAETL